MVRMIPEYSLHTAFLFNAFLRTCIYASRRRIMGSLRPSVHLSACSFSLTTEPSQTKFSVMVSYDPGIPRFISLYLLFVWLLQASLQTTEQIWTEFRKEVFSDLAVLTLSHNIPFQVSSGTDYMVLLLEGSISAFVILFFCLLRSSFLRACLQKCMMQTSGHLLFFRVGRLAKNGLF